MRLILFNRNPQQLDQWCQIAASRGHVVECGESGDLDLVMAQTIYDPDAILVEYDVYPTSKSYRGRQIGLPHIISVGPNSDAFDEELAKLESRFSRRMVAVPQECEQRVIFWDAEWPRIDKFRIPDLKAEDWQQKADLQEARFCLLLLGAAARLGIASKWLTEFELQLPALRRECAYRFCHGSWKAYAWAQEAKMRLCSFFCELLPTVEHEHLPPPTPPRSEARFVHRQLPMHLLYPFAQLMSFSIRPGLRNSVAQSLSEQPHLFSEALLSAHSAREMGIVDLLHQIAKAHVVVFKALLERSDKLEQIDREVGTVFEFWDMEFFNRMRMEDVRKIAAEILDGKTNVENPPQPVSYRQFIASLDVEQKQSGFRIAGSAAQSVGDELDK